MSEQEIKKPSSQTTIQVGDVKMEKTENTRRQSRNPFKKHNNKEAGEQISSSEIEMVDLREPKPSFKDAFTIYKIIGWNWLLILIGMIGSAGSGIIPLMFQFIMGDVITVFASTTMTTAEKKSQVSVYASEFAGIAAGAAVASLLSNFFLNYASERIGIALRTAYFDALTDQEMGYFDVKKVGAVTNTLYEDCTKVQEIYTTRISTFVTSIAQFAIGFSLSMSSSWKLTLVMISTTPIMIFGVFVLGGIIRKLTTMINKSNDHSAAMFTEVLSSMRTVRGMAGEEKEREKYGRDLKKKFLAGVGKAIAQGSTFGVMIGVLWGTVALCFWYGGGLVVSSELNIGSLMKVIGLSLFSTMGLIQVFAFFPDYTKAMVSQRVVLKVLKRKGAIPIQGGKKIETIKGHVRFENVDFIYPSRPNVTVLKNFSLDISSGQAVALVGPSGSGKSTIVGLLERFYDPAKGKVYIDDVDVAELDPMWLHKSCLGIVTQEPVLFATTIYGNIAYAIGEENATMEKVVEAAKAANCHSFISDLPEGYNTLLGEKGVSLSGGQKQRIAIARALLQDPKILLLDEATSALDTESEALVQAALDKLMKGRTSICIAHRLSTVKDCNQICVLAKGELREKGTHNELMEISNGIYKGLAEKQMLFSSTTEEEEEEDDEEEILIEDKSLNIVDC
ncbi:abc transporter AbcB1 [Naegleria gruberi]|uniref:Abc transporter AbcB1 n=1 Tax=Naegleria gruberi TaxID=5762 RepID=D2VVJ9_NAEGR|nr:abc transporter AbcB1 [Naegleria gruberi]EFC39126.1 abc transporter AbcB1 [Naegleria gruberi]|eukprot:XP_002671870.1 abc transporter AbcB1 [Naegleria gruberi strain NEG-M]